MRGPHHSKTAIPYHLKRYLHWIAVLIPALLTWHLWQASKQAQQEVLNRRFQKLVDRANNSLRSELSAYENALRSARGLIYANSNRGLTASEWKAYVDSLDLPNQYLGMIAISYVSYVKQSELAHYLSQMQADPGNRGFALRPEGARPDYMIIRQIQPIEPNRSAWGYDIGVEATRRAAALKARDSGRIVLTSKIKLVQSKNSGAGFLLLLPVYKTGNVPPTLEGRRSQLLGWISSPLLMRRLMDGLIDTSRSEVLFQIYDGSDKTPESTLYDETTLRPEVVEAHPRFTTESTINIAGHNWTVRVQTTRNFEKHVYNPYDIWSVPIAGAIAILSIILTMLGLQRARNQAMRLARRLTTSLRRTRDRLLLSRAIDRILIESDNPKQALQAVLSKMGNMLHAERLELWSWNENPALMRCEDNWTSSLPRLRPEQSAYFELFIKNGQQKKGLIKIYASIISPLDQQIAFELEAIGDRIGQFIHTRETENALKEQQALMVAHSKMSALGEMASGIAHEINNPLTIVQFRAAQIERSVLKLEDCPETLTAETQKLLQNTRSVKDMVERIAKIIRSLRSFTRNGSQDPFSLVEVQTIFDDVLPLCEKKLRSRGIVLDCQLPTESPLLECRPVELSQVLLNLINNATDAVESLNEKWIRIECQDLGDDLVLSVTDSGAGISREIENRIFDPFFTTKLAGQGTGLGLSISIGIVRAHGGSLTLDKKSAHTCFVIRLPKLQAEIISQSVT